MYLKRLLYGELWGLCEDGEGEGREMWVSLKGPPGQVMDNVMLYRLGCRACLARDIMLKKITMGARIWRCKIRRRRLVLVEVRGLRSL